MRRTNFTKKDQNVSSHPLENKELLEEKPLVEAADKSWEAPHFELDKITLNQSGTKKTKPNQWLDKNHILYIILAVLLLCGIGGGALFIRYADFSALETLDFLFFSNFQGRTSSALSGVFIASLASAFSFILSCFLCGLSIWGAFLIPFIPFFRGFGLGMTAGYLYTNYSWQGFLFYIAVILPGALLCCVSVLLASREGIRFSRRMSLKHRPVTDKTQTESLFQKLSTKTYLIRFMFVIGLALLAALIDVVTTASFSGLFPFINGN